MQNKNDKSLFGVDINEYTQGVDFAVLTTKIDFLYLRSSGSATGRFRRDQKFIEFAQKAREFGIPVGAYHFGVPADDLTTADAQCDDFIQVLQEGFGNKDYGDQKAREFGIPVGAYHFGVPADDLTTADAQCDDFIQVLQEGFGNKDYGDLFPVIDVEVPTDKSLAVETVVNWIDRFRKRFEKKTRRRIMLYTGTFYVELYNNFFIPGRGYPLKNMILWIAMYTAIPGNPAYPPDVGGWTRWRIWQYSESATVQGIGNPVDANWGPNSIDLLIQPRNVTGLRATKRGNTINIRWNPNNDADLLGYNLFANNYWIGTVDAIQPRNVTGLRATKRGNTINIRWNPNNDADLLGYNLFANNYWIGTVDAGDTDFTIPISSLPFTKSGPIKISIEAFDLDGETSKARTTVTV